MNSLQIMQFTLNTFENIEENTAKNTFKTAYRKL